jgi:hypothetical protein
MSSRNFARMRAAQKQRAFTLGLRRAGLTALPGGCDGTARCTSAGAHYTGCTRLEGLLEQWKQARRAFYAGRGASCGQQR